MSSNPQPDGPHLHNGTLKLPRCSSLWKLGILYDCVMLVAGHQQQMSSLLLTLTLRLEVADGVMTLGLVDSSSDSEEGVNHWISVWYSSTPQNWRSYLKNSRSCIHFLH